MDIVKNVISHPVSQHDVRTALPKLGAAIPQDTIDLIRGIPGTTKVQTLHYCENYSSDACDCQKSRGQPG
jgi:hypothetical protein